MKPTFQTSAILLLIALTGCATYTEVRFTSEPPGATLLVPRFHAQLIGPQPGWTSSGTTPCTVLLRTDMLTARLSLGTNQYRTLQLKGQCKPIRKEQFVGTLFLLQSSPGFLLAGPIVGPLLFTGAVGGGVTSLGTMQNQPDGQKNFHVDFNIIGGGWISQYSRQYVPLPDQTRLLTNPEKSRIYVMRLACPWDPFVRDIRLEDRAVQMEVRDGNMLIGSSSCGTYLCWEREAGRTTIAVNSPITSTNTVEIEMQKGHVYYVVQHLKFEWRHTDTILSLVDESVGLDALKQCGAPTVTSP
jgi:hypothetical protein